MSHEIESCIATDGVMQKDQGKGNSKEAATIQERGIIKTAPLPRNACGAASPESGIRSPIACTRILIFNG